jgi:hypothetical protein
MFSELTEAADGNGTPHVDEVIYLVVHRNKHNDSKFTSKMIYTIRKDMVKCIWSYSFSSGATHFEVTSGATHLTLSF